MSKKVLYIVLLIGFTLVLTGCKEKHIPNSLDVTKTKEVQLFQLHTTIPEEYVEMEKKSNFLGFQHEYKNRYYSDLTFQSDLIDEKELATAEDYLKYVLTEEIAQEYTVKEETINEIDWTKASYQTSNGKEEIFYNSDVYIARHEGRFYIIIFGYNYKDNSYKKTIKQIIENVEFK
jgi:hypothetical protein